MASVDFSGDSRRKVGECIILNYEVYEKHMCLENRKGSECDADRLDHVFSELNFHVQRPPRNLSRSETLNVLKGVSETVSEESEYFVCCVLTHGDQEDRLAAKDRWLDMDEFLSNFYPSKGFLIGKPKIFIIQACRGSDTEKLLRTESTDSVISDYALHPDFIIARSTYPGKLSFKNSDGSYFIQELCSCLEQFSKDQDLIQILTVVNYRMGNFFVSYSRNPSLSGSGQMPYFVSTLKSQVLFQKSIKPYESSGTHLFNQRRALYRPNLSAEKYPHLDLKIYNSATTQTVECFQIVIKKNGPRDLKLAVADLSVYLSEKYSEQTRCNLKKSEIKKEIISFASNTSANCTICFVATPSKGDYLCDKGGRKFSKSNVIENFVGAQPQSLVGKPKIFIFLMCEANAPMESTDAFDIDEDLDSFFTSQHADILDITIAIKNPELLRGLMNRFVFHLKEYGQSKNLLSILTKFNLMLYEEGNFQTGNPRSVFSFSSTLTKKIFLP